MEAKRLDAYVVKESRKLLGRADKLLAKQGKLVDRASLTTSVAQLREAVKAGNAGDMRALLPLVDGLVDAEMAAVPVSFVRELFESVGTALLVAILLRLFVLEAFKIPSSSMIPTLEIGDYLFVNKFVYGPRIPFADKRLFTLRGPERGEVAVFVYPCDGRNFIKRIVAVAGDTVEMRCSKLYINGQEIPQQLVGEECSFYDTSEYMRQDCSEVSSSWSKCPCSRYREQMGEFVFDTNYVEDRPNRDREEARADAGDHGYLTRSTDFPQLPHSERILATDARFQCTDLRGGVEVVTKDRGVLGRFEPAASPSTGACGPKYHYVVPPGYVFAMGDNRDHSNDSRFWGPVSVSELKGKAMFVFWSGADPSGLRLERFGQFVHQDLTMPSPDALPGK